ncbi:MAG TPA: hypothetical protein VLH15_01770 [Dehalococcoidales bacterium]|nr:hypothetical protein [Dehalococcoidales bacterium]
MLSTIIAEYLESVKSNLRLEPSAEKEVMAELANHIEDEISELKQRGLRDEEAANVCLNLLGSAKVIARMIYEAHSQGSWRQALMASLPHVLFGMIFILNWWRGITPVLITLVVISAIAVYGWWHGRSTWLFPWLGYLLLPVISAGLSLIYLPQGFSWIAILVYIPLAFWLVMRVVRHTIKKDWIYLSLMLLPLPVIVAWFAVTEVKSWTDIKELMNIFSFGPWLGLSFLSLGIGVVTFVRMRKRWLKVAVLFLTGIITLFLVTSYAWGRITTVDFLLLSLLTASIFLIPALLENGVKTGKWGKIFDHRPS